MSSLTPHSQFLEILKNSSEEEKKSMLAHACHLGELKKVKAILKENPLFLNAQIQCFEINNSYENALQIITNDGFTPLMFAMANIQKKVIDFLLKQPNIDVNKPSEGLVWTPLLLSAYTDLNDCTNPLEKILKEDYLFQLLDKKADFWGKDKYDNSIFSMISARKEWDILNRLFDYDWIPHSKKDIKDLNFNLTKAIRKISQEREKSEEVKGFIEKLFSVISENPHLFVEQSSTHEAIHTHLSLEYSLWLKNKFQTNFDPANRPTNSKIRL